MMNMTVISGEEGGGGQRERKLKREEKVKERKVREKLNFEI